MSPQVFCIGLANWDYLFTVDAVVEEDHKYRSSNLIGSGGGPSANAACLLARWGCPVVLVAHAGNDVLGKQVLEELNEQGVDTSWFQLIDGETTSLSCVITNAQSGARTVVNHPPRSVLPRARELLPTHAPRAVLFDGHEPELSHLALEQYPAAISILDGGSLRDSTATLASKVDYAIVSSAFAKRATGISPTNSESIARCVEALSRRFSSRIAITLGPLGVGTLTEEGTVLHLNAPNVVAVDSTAAGDLFHGAFVWAMVNGYDYIAALRVAMGAAALSVTRPGGRSSIPELDLTLRFVAECWPLPNP